MTRNTKIALGCGGAGCLGLIVVVIAVGMLIVFGAIKAPGIYNPDSNSNYNSNYNGNYNYNSNSNSSNTNDNLNSNSDDSSSSMSEDDKHKLYQAAAITKDNELIFRMLKKIGLGNGAGADHQQFLKEHLPWAMRNAQFVQSISTPEAARAYFDEHIDD